MIAGTAVKHLTADGKELDSVAGVAKPTALAFDNQGRLIVRDGGPDQPVRILTTHDGVYSGTMMAGPEVGGNAGREDMPYAVQAMKRKSGEYLVLVEEDWRGKILPYRWQPTANKTEKGI